MSILSSFVKEYADKFFEKEEVFEKPIKFSFKFIADLKDGSPVPKVSKVDKCKQKSNPL